MGESPRVRFVLDMYDIGDREYVEGLGAPGTADYWLREAKEILEEEWEAFYPA